MPVKGGTHSDPARQRIAEANRGQKNPKAKLTDAQVLEVAVLADSGLSYREIAKRYGVSAFCIYYALRWRGPGRQRRANRPS